MVQSKGVGFDVLDSVDEVRKRPLKGLASAEKISESSPRIKLVGGQKN